LLLKGRLRDCVSVISKGISSMTEHSTQVVATERVRCEAEAGATGGGDGGAESKVAMAQAVDIGRRHWS
jgi:hypothetical protein